MLVFFCFCFPLEILQQNSANMKLQWGVIEKWLEERRIISRSYKRKLEELNELVLKVRILPLVVLNFKELVFFRLCNLI